MDRKTYVEFYFPGVLVDETSVKETDHRDPESVTVSPMAFGFRFFDRLVSMEGDVELKSQPINYSPMYYYGGKLMNLEDVKREMPDASILISNMERNGYDWVIHCRTGNFKPFEPDDILLENGRNKG